MFEINNLWNKKSLFELFNSLISLNFALVEAPMKFLFSVKLHPAFLKKMFTMSPKSHWAKSGKYIGYCTCTNLCFAKISVKISASYIFEKIRIYSFCQSLDHNFIIYIYIYIYTSLSGRGCHTGSILNGVLQFLIPSFPSRRPVTIPKLNSTAYPTIYS